MSEWVPEEAATAAGAPEVPAALRDQLPYRIVRPFRVRFEESTASETIRAAIYLAWTADVAWQHSTLLGFGRDWYSERGLFWLVRAIRLDVLAPIHTYDGVFVSTRVVGYRRISARRESEVRDPAGELLARLEIDWVMTNERGVPTRVPDDFHKFVVDGAASFEMLKVALPSGAAGRRRAALPRPPARPGPAGPRQQQRLPRLLRGGARGGRAGRAAARYAAPLPAGLRQLRRARRAAGGADLAARRRLGLPPDPRGRHRHLPGAPRTTGLGSGGRRSSAPADYPLPRRTAT